MHRRPATAATARTDFTMAKRGSRDKELLDLFERAGKNAAAAAVVLDTLLGSIPDVAKLSERVLEAEQEGDRITHAILRKLDTASKPYQDVGDLHTLASAVDDIVDHSEEAADMIGRYGIEAPMVQASELGGILAEAAAEVAGALKDLRKGNDLTSRIVELHRLENEGDRVSREGLGALFAGGIDPMVVIRWKDVYESLEKAVDACEGVAHALETLTLRRGSA
ncbi:MAG: DUF47 family protein [Actinobacteria bacterium]|nr:DUF47 family protein [Actinomycetota bacterium]